MSTVNEGVPLTDQQKSLKETYNASGLIGCIKMDEANAAAAAVLVTEGGKAAVSHMFARPDGSTRSYSEMRRLYG
jgi:hypothetical protein